MIHHGKIVGAPLVDYSNTQANIEALTLGAGDAGATAWATDTGQLGVFDGADWRWGRATSHADWPGRWDVWGYTGLDATPRTILTAGSGTILLLNYVILTSEPTASTGQQEMNLSDTSIQRLGATDAYCELSGNGSLLIYYDKALHTADVMLWLLWI